jgi:hypothetical protein
MVTTTVPALLAGAAVGLGLVMIVAGWRGSAPGTAASGTGSVLDGPVRRAAEKLASTHPGIGSGPMARALHLDRRRQDLALLQESMQLLVVRSVACGFAGLAAPGVVALVLAMGGVPIGAGPSLTVGLVMAGLLAPAPALHVKMRAATARQEMRRVVCAVLDLVALERAADAGPVEAIERAVSISTTPPFTRLRQTLTRAELAGLTPWRGLRDLAEAIGVVELADLADILASSGRDGAAVCTSLRARATALRAAITAGDTAAANARSEYMVIPVAALGLIFMAFLAYPALSRLITGT